MTTTVRPFHETIVEAIRVCGPASSGRIFILTRLIRDTAIPKGHDQILAAIDEYFDFPGSNKYARDIREVKESLLAQKQAAKGTDGKGKSERALMVIIEMLIQRHHTGKVHLDETSFRLFELAKRVFMIEDKKYLQDVLDELAKFKE